MVPVRAGCFGVQLLEGNRFEPANPTAHYAETAVLASTQIMTLGHAELWTHGSTVEGNLVGAWDILKIQINIFRNWGPQNNQIHTYLKS